MYFVFVIFERSNLKLQFFVWAQNNVYMHCQKEGCSRFYIYDDQMISQGRWDVQRAKGEVRKITI